MADIIIPRAEAEKIYELFNNVAAADAHYQRCQSDNFRQHVQSVYRNPRITGAFEALKRRLDKPAEEASQANIASKRSKSVLTGD